MPTLFDPLRHLRVELRVEVFLGGDGLVYIRFDNRASNQTKAEARATCMEHGRLIKLQLESGGVSVQKLRAHGKVKIVGGQAIVVI